MKKQHDGLNRREVMTRALGIAGMGGIAVAASIPRTARAAGKYDVGASDAEILIGNTAPYSGPASQFGVLGKAMESYFKSVNDAGGVNGRKIRFVSADDGYSPPKTVEQTRRLVEEDKVLFLVGSVGTSTQSAVQKYLNGKKIPQLFLLGGSSRWGNPKEFPWTMGWSPTYAAEARVYAKYILANIPNPKIAVLYNNDDFGKDYLEGLRSGLGDKASLIVAEATTVPADATVDSQILQLRASGANVLLNAGPGKGAIQGLRKANEIGWKPAHFLNSNSTDVEAFLKVIGLDNAVGVMSATYRKDPSDPVWANDPGVLAWKAWMAKYNPDAGLGNELYGHGYSVAQSVVEVLRQCGDDLTRANVMKQAASLREVRLPLLLPGATLNTSATDYFPIKTLRLSRFNGKRWETFGENVTVS